MNICRKTLERQLQLGRMLERELDLGLLGMLERELDLGLIGMLFDCEERGQLPRVFAKQQFLLDH